MKSITEFIKENINESNSTLEMEDVVSAIENVCDGDDWYLDAHGSRKGTFADAVKDNGSIYDVLEFATMWDALAEELDCEEDEIIDFVYDNDEELQKELGIKK